MASVTPVVSQVAQAIATSITQAGAGGGGADAAIFFEAMAVGFKEDADVACCRFAQALPLTETTGLVFFTQKHVNYTGNDENAQRMCVRDYTIDFEAESITFSATRVIEQPALWTTGKGWVSEPFALVLTQGPNPGRILLLNNRNDHVDQMMANAEYNLYSRYSDDGGDTWSSPALCVAYTDGLASSGQCIELPSGRLVYAVWNTTTLAHGSINSDDHGATWARCTTFASDGSEAWSEPSLFRGSDGTLYQFVRGDSADTERERGVFSSTDEGDVWAWVGSSSAAAFKNSNTACLNDDGFLMMGSTASTVYYDRNLYRLRVSTDDGTTFPTEWAPFGDIQGTGYSQLGKIRENTYALGYETFNPQSNSTPFGHINNANNCVMAVFNRSAINAAAETRPAPAETAAQLYTAYASRVTTDGGTVTDPTACQAAIQAAIDGGYWLDSGIAVSANWGVKLSGAVITKLYDLTGTNDVTEFSGNPGTTIDTTTYAWATINFGDNTFYALTPAIPINNGADPYALCFSGTGNVNGSYIGIEGAASAQWPLFMQIKSGGVTGGPLAVWDASGNGYYQYNVPSAAVGSGNCAFIEPKTNRFTWILDGTTEIVMLAGSPLARNVTRKICLNGFTVTGGGAPAAASIYKLYEIWHLAYATRETAAQLSADQGVRYA